MASMGSIIVCKRGVSLRVTPHLLFIGFLGVLGVFRVFRVLELFRLLFGVFKPFSSSLILFECVGV